MADRNHWLQHLHDKLTYLAAGGTEEPGTLMSFDLRIVNFMNSRDRKASCDTIRKFKKQICSMKFFNSTETQLFDECLNALDMILESDDAIRARTCKFIDNQTIRKIEDAVAGQLCEA